MLQRWFHLPRLHVPSHHAERKVSWLELFYDLVYVAAIIQLGDALSHHVDLLGVLGFAAVLAPLWLTWTGFTFFSNRFVVDDALHRGLVFLQMFGIGGVALSVSGVLEGDLAPFTVTYALTRLTLAAMYLRAWRHTEAGRDLSAHFAQRIGLGALCWLGTTLLSAPWVYLGWLICMGIDLSVALGAKGRDLSGRYTPDIHHMSERYGIFTLIVLGESFVKLIAGVSGVEISSSHAAMAAVGLLVTISLWWIYFDDVAGSRIKNLRMATLIWVYSHMPMTIAVTAVGVAIKKATLLDPFAVADAKTRWLMAGSLSLALFWVGVIDAVTERRQSELSDKARVEARLLSSALVLLLAPAGAFMPAWAFMGLVAVACVVQVVFDLSMAPLQALPEEHQPVRHTPLPGSQEPVTRLPSPSRGRMLTQDAVRVGTPDDLRRDMYFHLMSASWGRVLAALIVVFVLINVVFASLYLLQPGSVSNMENASFIDVLSFSVQTLTTIGYGGMLPVTPYGHVLVIIEAFVGVFGAALATGILFARASRPRSSVLFSQVAVITTRNGMPTLELRVGNARGNEIIEAAMRLVILREEVTPEGHRMRRLVDLPLVRDSSPLFSLTWTVMHNIDDKSPLYGITVENAEEKLLGVLALLTGFDATYSQTVHARNFYTVADLRFNERFQDVVGRLPDGRMLVDYNRFHDTVPDQT